MCTLSRTRGKVAPLLEKLWEGGPISAKDAEALLSGAVIQDARGLRAPPRHKRVAGRDAHLRIDVGLLKHHAVFGQLIKVWRVHELMSVGT